MRALAAVRCSANTALRKIQILLGVGLWGDAVKVSREEQERLTAVSLRYLLRYCGTVGTVGTVPTVLSQIPLPSVPYPPSGGARRR